MVSLIKQHASNWIFDGGILPLPRVGDNTSSRSMSLFELHERALSRKLLNALGQNSTLNASIGNQGEPHFRAPLNPEQRRNRLLSVTDEALRILEETSEESLSVDIRPRRLH